MPKSRPMRREWRNMKELHNRDGCDGSAGEHRWTMKHWETPSRYMFGTLHDHYMIITWSLHDDYMIITWSLLYMLLMYFIWLLYHMNHMSCFIWKFRDLELAMTWRARVGNDNATTTGPERPHPSDCMTCLTCTSWYILYILIILCYIMLSSSDIRVKETRNHTKPSGPRKCSLTRIDGIFCHMIGIYMWHHFSRRPNSQQHNKSKK